MIRKILRKLMSQKTPEERARQQLFAVKLKKSDVAIDCGANVGEITQHLCKSGATVYAFEPNPYAFKILKDKFSNAQNVYCFEKGVLDRNETRRLYFHEFSDKDEVHWSTGSSLLDYKGNILKEKYVEISVIDISEFIRSLNSRIKLLKIDVEGVECSIVKKLINTGVINKIDYLFVETHDHKIPELKSETDELRQMIKTMKLMNINLDWI